MFPFDVLWETKEQGHLYKAIKEYCAETGNAVETACSMLQVSRASYYRCLSGKKSSRAAENEIIAEKIEQIHTESPDKGYRRINDDLRPDYGICINDKRAFATCSLPLAKISYITRS